ncbi:MAG: RNA polymerase sigma factor [bacterium]|nr:RNA polymerase sigma factor [bacterium]
MDNSTVVVSPLSDEQILDAARNDRPGGFDALVERYGRRLFAFGMRMCGHREDAEDVFQETLLQAYKGLDSLREPGAVRTWLFRVVANQCLMKRRKDPPEREVSLDELKPPGWERGEPEQIPDWSALATKAVEQAELRATLERAVGELPKQLRVVLLLRDLEGLSTRETAEVLGLGSSTVKMRLHRARLALRRRLSEQVERT